MKLLQNIKFFLYKRKMIYKRKVYRDRLFQLKNVTINPSAIGYQDVLFEGENVIPENCQFIGEDVFVGFRTTLGRNNLLSGDVTVGKYCQLGADVALHANDHPISYMSTYINQKLFGGELKKLKNNYKITIGNDVWIGHGVIVVGNVTIGSGAILAAGTVVTKDVPSYAIVAGIPGKVIKKRFSSLIISELEELKWWDLSDDDLIKKKPLFFKDFSTTQSIYE